MTREAAGASVAQLKQIAAAIPGLDETTSYGTLAFKYKKKLVARVREDCDDLVVAMDFVNRDLLMSAKPKVFRLKQHYLDYPYVLVRLSAITPAALAEQLRDACERVKRGLARKRLARWFRTLPDAQWTHGAHIAVAVTYLRVMPYDQALVRMRTQINHYNQQFQDPTGYHETVRVLFLRQIDRQLKAVPANASIAATVNSLASTLDMKWPFQHYSPELLWSDRARHAWVDPDRMPLEP